MAAHTPHTTRIYKAFDRFSHSYDDNSAVQKEIAAAVIESLPPTCAPRTILEIGCGTGHLTKKLAARFPDTAILATDISPHMIDRARHACSAPHITYTAMDGQNLPATHRYDLIISNMTIQWFNDINATYARWREHLTPGGIILTSRPGPRAFIEWQRSLQALNLPSGLLNVQSTPHMHKDITIKQRYPDTLSFLRTLRHSGAATARAGYTAITPQQLKQACAHCDRQSGATLSWHIIIDKIENATASQSGAKS